jgi:spoIIIJ-associated protein
MSSEICQNSKDFVEAVLKGSGLDLHIAASSHSEGCLIDIKGEDSSFLRNEGGELLDALEHLVNQAYGRDLPKGERIVCDVESFRATREAELRAMAHHAASRVHSTGTPFFFGPMQPQERRVIHLELANDETLLTESVGEGHERRLKVSLKKT